MLTRDHDAQHMSVDEGERLFAQRYMPGQSLYLSEVHPSSLADIVIDNTDFENPRIIHGYSSDLE
jgi:uridine kinase